jgi:hypothetical protein
MEGDEWDAMKMNRMGRSSRQGSGAVIPRSFTLQASVFADACGDSRFLRPLEVTILEARYQPS